MKATPAARRRRPHGWAVLAAWLVTSLVPLGCQSYIGTTAASYLRKVRDDPDPNTRYLAYAKLAAPGCYDSQEQKTEAVRTLVGKLKKGLEPVATRAVICHTLGELREPEARDAILKAVNDPDGVVRVEACRALGKVGRPEDATVLARVMTVDTLEDCRIAAVEALAELKANDPRISRMLVDGMRHDDPALRFASLNALKSITGKDLGVDPAPWSKLLDDTEGTEALAAGGSSAAAPGDLPPRHEIPNGLSELPLSAAQPPRDRQTRPATYPPTPPASNVPVIR